MKTSKQTVQQKTPDLSKATVKPVFDGKGQHQEPLTSCSDECVGGTANTQAMSATNLDA